MNTTNNNDNAIDLVNTEEVHIYDDDGIVIETFHFPVTTSTVIEDSSDTETQEEAEVEKKKENEKEEMKKKKKPKWEKLKKKTKKKLNKNKTKKLKPMEYLLNKYKYYKQEEFLM